MLLSNLLLTSPKTQPIDLDSEIKQIAMIHLRDVVEDNLMFSSFHLNHVCTPVTDADDCITPERKITSSSPPPLL